MAVIFFTKFFEASVSGFYFFANRILKMPFGFFISAFSDVFYQKLSKTKDYKEIANEINQFSLKIFKITILPFLIIVYSSYFYVESIFGEKWRELYLYIDIFALPIYIGLLLAPYGHVLKIIDRQEISMYWHAIKLVILFCFFFFYIFFSYSNTLYFLYLYSLLDTLLSIIFVMNINFILQDKKNKSLWILLIIFIFFIAINWFLIKEVI
jgi:O-antigen/teichoic acid export membrane protein